MLILPHDFTNFILSYLGKYDGMTSSQLENVARLFKSSPDQKAGINRPKTGWLTLVSNGPPKVSNKSILSVINSNCFH